MAVTQASWAKLATQGRPRRGTGDSRLRFVRHPLRVLAMSIAAVCVTWPITSLFGVAAAAGGAALGVVLGELLGRSRLRAPVVVALLGALLALFAYLGHLSTHSELIPSAVGPATALKVATLVRFGAYALFPVAIVRALASRRPTLTAIELVAVVAAVSFLFAAHRGGVVARPMWLSDWAWRHDIDPVRVLMTVGGGAFLLLAAIMWAETGKRVSAISALALPAIAALIVSLFDLKNLPKPRDENDLGLTSAATGEPPTAMPTGGPSGGPLGGDAGDDGGGQGQDAADAGDGGGQGDDAGDADGGGGQGDDAGDADGGGQGADAADADGGGQGQGQDASDDGGGQQNPPDASQDGGGGQPPPEQPPIDQPPDSDDSKASPMAIVLLGDDYNPPQQSFYFRQEAWSQYNGSRLVATTRGDVDRDVPSDYPTRPVPVQELPPPAGRKLIHATVSMLVEHKRPFALESPTMMAPMRNPNTQRFVRAYKFESLAQTIEYKDLIGKKVGNPAWTPEVLAYYTKPADDKRFAELAKLIVSKLPAAKRKDPFLQALAIKLWMDKNLIYSTKHRHAGVADPTADFLFGDRTGYCVHFAHAAVFMWRSLGIPARAGTGYSVDAQNRQGSAIPVRGGDAHAWPEIYFEGLGWIILDIAAERNLDPPPKPAADDETKKLAEMAREQPEDPLENPPGTEPPGGRQSRDRFPVWIVLVAVAAALALGFYAVKAWRRLAPRFASRRTMPRVGYRAALDVLSEAGFSRAFGETREHFARRVAQHVPAIEELTAMHMAAHLGDPNVPIEQRAEFATAAWKKGLSDVKKQVRRAAGGVRLVLNKLNPASFLASR